MILTLTQPECLALTVRGDVPGVLDGCGVTIEAYIGPDTGWIPCPMIDSGPAFICHNNLPKRLPLANSLVQAHLVGWMGRGEKCPHHGSFLDAAIEGLQSPAGCRVCRGTGWIRDSFDCYAWLKPESHGGSPDWARLAVIKASVDRVAAGLPPIRGLLGPWRTVKLMPSRTNRPEHLRPFVLVRDSIWGPVGGSQAIPRDCRALDATRMADGIALIDNTPTSRVIRFEVPNATP